MIFECFPRGRVDYRTLDLNWFCEWEDYPRYMPEEPLWQQPFTLTLPKGMCLGSHLFTRHGDLVTFDPPIYDRWTCERIRKSFRKFRPSEIEHFPGTLVTFDTSFGDSYGHWISEVVPCFSIARMLDEPGHKYYLDMGRTDNLFKADTLEALGFSVERLIDDNEFPYEGPCFDCKDVIDFRQHPVVSADKIVFVRKTRYSWWARDFVRHSFMNLAEPRRRDRRLYFSRSQDLRRHVLNEDKVIAMLSRYGFETVTKDDFWVPYADQVRMFREADIVVTQRASIFYGLWYCKKAFNLVTLWQKGENKYPGIVDKFEHVTHIDCEAVPCEDFPDDRNCDDLIVDVEELRNAVERMLAVHDASERALPLKPKRYTPRLV